MTDTEPFPTTTFLDPALTDVLGPVDQAAGAAIGQICNEAAAQVLGADIAAVIGSDAQRLAAAAPWVWDVARGLQFLSRGGNAGATTAAVLSHLAPGLRDRIQLDRLGDAVDLSIALTLDRLLEPVLGPDACSRLPEENEAALPWLIPLKLGYRLHVTLELLRLIGVPRGC